MPTFGDDVMVVVGYGHAEVRQQAASECCALKTNSGAAAGAVQAPAKPARERRQLKRIYVDLCADTDFQTPPPVKSTRKN